MTLLIVPLFLVLLILIIFYIFDLHLSIKTTSKLTDDKDSILGPQVSTSWMNYLSGVTPDISDNILSDVTPDTPITIPEFSDSTQESEPDVSGSLSGETPLQNYNRDEMLSLIQNMISTNVTLNDVDGIYGNDTNDSGNNGSGNDDSGNNGSGNDDSGNNGNGNDTDDRITELEALITNFITDYSNNNMSPIINIPDKTVNIFSDPSMNFMLCNKPTPIDGRNCDTWEGCAEKCSANDDCIGWVNDTSENTMFTCMMGDAAGDLKDDDRYESVQKTMFTAWVPGFNNEIV
mgnify:CR=1 FL=1